METTKQQPIPEIAAIARRRIRLNLPRYKFAKIAGVSVGHYNNLETGQTRNPSLDVMHKLTDAIRGLENEQRKARKKLRK